MFNKIIDLIADRIAMNLKKKYGIDNPQEVKIHLKIEGYDEVEKKLSHLSELTNKIQQAKEN